MDKRIEHALRMKVRKILKEMAEKYEDPATLEDMAKELGYAGAPGALAAINKATNKFKYLFDKYESSPAEIEQMIKDAQRDYIKELLKLKAITPNEADLYRQHPEHVSNLDSFRVFLKKHIKDKMKSAEPMSSMKRLDHLDTYTDSYS